MSETSKFLSYVLRHAPQSIGLQLDKGRLGRHRCAARRRSFKVPKA
jgi:RNA:NAD 2'-phosphotransferase (TPT1/KptA family)